MSSNSTYKWLTRLVAGALIPSYLVAVCSQIYALPRAGAAEVYTFRNSNNSSSFRRLQMGTAGAVGFMPWERAPRRLVTRQQFLYVPSSSGNEQVWARLEHIHSNGTRSRLAVQAGPTSSDASYSFPCGAAGGPFVIGWHSGSSGGWCNNTAGFTIRLNSSASRSNSSDKSTTFAQKDSATSQAAEKDSLVSQVVVANTTFQYCSVAAKEQGWWVNWGTLGDPCDSAFQACLNVASERDCEIVGTGNWYARDPEVLVTVGCADNRIYTMRGVGRDVAASLISQISSEAKADGDRVCTLNVYRPQDVIVSPASESPTLVVAESTSSSLSISVLTGNVVIRTADKTEGFLVEAGNQYTYPNDRTQPINVSQVVQSPPVQIFLDRANWSSDTIPDLEAYLRALRGESTPDSNSPRRRSLFEQLLPVVGLLGLAGLAVGLLDDSNDDSESSDSDSDNPDPPSTTTTISQINQETGRIEANPTDLSFSSLSPKTITLTNRGSAPLRVSRIEISSLMERVPNNPDGSMVSFTPSTPSEGFTITNNQCSNIDIAPAGTCQFTVNFSRFGYYTANLSVFSNAENSELIIPLSSNVSPIIW